MAGHSGEKRWSRNQFGDEGIGTEVRNSARHLMEAIVGSENVYQDLLELWQFAGPTDQAVADQLFLDVWSVRESDPTGNPGVLDTQANAVEVAQVADAKAAMLAVHELYEALTNQAITTADRIKTIRRMT